MKGSTKYGEYCRTIEMLEQMTGKSKKDLALILYFLHDSQYDAKDLKAMADIVSKRGQSCENTPERNL